MWQDAKGYRFHCWDFEDLYLSPQRQIYLIWQFNPLRDVLTVIKERTSAFKVSLPPSSAFTLNRNPTSWLFYPSQFTLECNLEGTFRKFLNSHLYVMFSLRLCKTMTFYTFTICKISTQTKYYYPSLCKNYIKTYFFPFSKIHWWSHQTGYCVRDFWLDLLCMKTIRGLILQALYCSTQLGLAAKPAALQADCREEEIWAGYLGCFNWDYRTQQGGWGGGH